MNPAPPIHWVQVDEAGRPTGPEFDGSRTALQSHLTAGLGDPRPVFNDDLRGHVWLHPRSREFVGHVVEVKLPWGKWRWLANPPDLTDAF